MPEVEAHVDPTDDRYLVSGDRRLLRVRGADDTQAPDETQGSGDANPEAPEGDTPQQEIDYQKRYDDLRSEFDRRNQQWSKYEQDPNEFLREHGYELAEQEEPEDEVELEEDLDPYETRLSALEARQQQEALEEQQDQYEDAVVDHINGELTELVKDTGREFSEDEFQTLGDLSRILVNDQGIPDVKAAYQRIYEGVLSKERDRWVNSKKAPQVSAGRAGSSAPNLDNPEERREYMAQRLAQEQG